MKSSNIYIDATAIVHAEAVVGAGTKIWNWTKVREGSKIGAGCSVGQSGYIDIGVVIGDGCKIQNGVSIYDGVIVGDHVFIGPSATFTNDHNPRANNPNWQITQTVVEEGASIGASATIVCGVTLGVYCMIAAGAVVTKDVSAHGLVMGTPARLVDYVTKNGSRLNWDMSSSTLPSTEQLLGNM